MLHLNNIFLWFYSEHVKSKLNARFDLASI